MAGLIGFGRHFPLLALGFAGVGPFLVLFDVAPFRQGIRAHGRHGMGRRAADRAGFPFFQFRRQDGGLGLEEQGPDTFIGHAFVPCLGGGFFQEVLTVLPLFPGLFQLLFQGSGLAFALEPVAQGLPAGFGLFRRYGLFGQAGDGFPGLVEGLFFCFLFLPHLVPAPFSFACRLAAPFFFQAAVPVGAGFFLQARQLDPFFAGCLITALTGRKGRQLPLGFSQVLLSLLGQLTGFFSRLMSLFALFFQVVEVTARFGQDFSLEQDGDGIPFFLEPAGLVLELRRFPALLFPQEPVIFQGLGGLEGRLAGLAPGFSLVPLCIDGGAFILPGFLFIRQLFFAGDAQVGQALFPPLAYLLILAGQGVVAGFGQFLEPRVALGMEEGLHDLLAFTGTGQEELAEVALRQEDDLAELVGLEAQQPFDGSRHVLGGYELFLAAVFVRFI